MSIYKIQRIFSRTETHTKRNSITKDGIIINDDAIEVSPSKYNQITADAEYEAAKRRVPKEDFEEEVLEEMSKQCTDFNAISIANRVRGRRNRNNVLSNQKV